MSSRPIDTSYEVCKASAHFPESTPCADATSSPYFFTGNEYLNSLDTKQAFHRAVGMRHFPDSDLLNPGSDPRFAAELKASASNHHHEEVDEDLDQCLDMVHMMIEYGKKALKECTGAVRKHCPSIKARVQRYEKMDEGRDTKEEDENVGQRLRRLSMTFDPAKRHSALIRDISDLLNDDEVNDGLMREAIRQDVIETMSLRLWNRQ